MKEHRSIFWPLTLIAAGVLWLMVVMKVIPAANLWALTHIWPYVLIALGMGLILRTLWKPLGVVISTLIVVGAMAAVFYAPQLGWAGAPAWGIDNSINGAIPGSGVMARETRETEGFDSISIRFPAKVTISQGSKESVIVEAEDNLLPQLATDVRSGTLFIKNNETNWAKRVDPRETVKITIVVKNLKEISFSSAGSLVVENLESDELRLSISGAGEVTLSGLRVGKLDVSLSGAGTILADGKVEDVNVSISGLGSFEGKGLSSQVATVDISGAGSATLRVEKELTARVSGAGSINYYGDPAVRQHISGAGSVKKAGD
jgi:energy-converting hydrogenase Eha subunit A